MRYFSLAFIAVVLFSSAHAQFIKIGPKAGVNMVKLDGVSLTDEFQYGYYGGAFIELKLGKKFYLQPEVLFSETTLKNTTQFEDVYRNLLNVQTLTSIKLQTLAIPLTLNWRIANVLALSAGPQFSINMNKGESLMKNAEAAITDGDVAMLAGMNVMLTKFRINARYSWGIKNQNNVADREPWKQQTLQLGIGFVF